MGLLDQIIGTLGGQEPVERLAREEANFDDPQSPDVAHWNELVGAAPQEFLAYDRSGDPLARLPWDPHTRQARTVWRR
jgi:hypothetical protein